MKTLLFGEQADGLLSFCFDFCCAVEKERSFVLVPESCIDADNQFVQFGLKTSESKNLACTLA